MEPVVVDHEGLIRLSNLLLKMEKASMVSWQGPLVIRFAGQSEQLFLIVTTDWYQICV